MDLRDDDETCPDEPGFDANQSSEHFLKVQQKKKKTKSSSSLLSPAGLRDEDGSDCSSNNSKYKTCVQDKDGELKNEFVFKTRQNPKYGTYLAEEDTRPKFLEKPKFLSKNKFEKVALACYQRSGSSLLRKYIENITGILTGSDGDLLSETDKQLKDAGLAGESVLGSRVWIANTNFPEDIGVARTMINKCILLVRNPCDAIYGHFHMLATRSIDKKLTEEEFKEMAPAWDEFVKQEIKIWKEFIDYWMIEPLVPTHVVRHEDLVENPKETLTDLFRFLLNTKKLDGLLIEKLIKEETSSDKKDLYFQKEPGFSFENFDDDHLNYINSEAGMTLIRLGYVKKVYGKVRQIAKTDFFENDSAIKSSKDHEVEKLVRNQVKTEVSMRYPFDDLNKLQFSEKYISSNYFDKILSGEIPELEINQEVEHLRTKNGRDMEARKVFMKLKHKK